MTDSSNTNDNTEVAEADDTPVFSRRNMITAVCMGAGFAVLLIVSFVASQIIGKPFYEVTALKPDSNNHLVNILTFPFAHLNIAHLISNLLPMTVLLMAMGLKHARETVIALIGGLIFSGFGVWLFENPDNYVIGASGILASTAIYALYVGIRDRAIVPGFIGSGIILITGASILTAQEGTSIIAHVSGLASGVALVLVSLAYRLITRQPSPSADTRLPASGTGTSPSA